MANQSTNVRTFQEIAFPTSPAPTQPSSSLSSTNRGGGQSSLPSVFDQPQSISSRTPTPQPQDAYQKALKEQETKRSQQEAQRTKLRRTAGDEFADKIRAREEATAFGKMSAQQQYTKLKESGYKGSYEQYLASGGSVKFSVQGSSAEQRRQREEYYAGVQRIQTRQVLADIDRAGQITGTPANKPTVPISYNTITNRYEKQAAETFLGYKSKDFLQIDQPKNYTETKQVSVYPSFFGTAMEQETSKFAQKVREVIPEQPKAKPGDILGTFRYEAVEAVRAKPGKAAAVFSITAGIGLATSLVPGGQAVAPYLGAFSIGVIGGSTYARTQVAASKGQGTKEFAQIFSTELAPGVAGGFFGYKAGQGIKSAYVYSRVGKIKPSAGVGLPRDLAETEYIVNTKDIQITKDINQPNLYRQVTPKLTNALSIDSKGQMTINKEFSLSSQIKQANVDKGFFDIPQTEKTTVLGTMLKQKIGKSYLSSQLILEQQPKITEVEDVAINTNILTGRSVFAVPKIETSFSKTQNVGRTPVTMANFEQIYRPKLKLEIERPILITTSLTKMSGLRVPKTERVQDLYKGQEFGQKNFQTLKQFQSLDTAYKPVTRQTTKLYPEFMTPNLPETPFRPGIGGFPFGVVIRPGQGYGMKTPKKGKRLRTKYFVSPSVSILGLKAPKGAKKISRKRYKRLGGSTGLEIRF